MLSAVHLIEFDFLVSWYQIVHVYAAMKLQVHQQIIHVGQIQLVLFLFDRLVKEIDSIFHMSLFSCCSLYPITHTSSHFQFCVVSGRFLSKNDVLFVFTPVCLVEGHVSFVILYFMYTGQQFLFSNVLQIVFLSFFFWPLYCLCFFDLRFLVNTLVSSGHCIVCISLIYGFWLTLWYLLAIVLFVFL